ncbi:MAG: glycosyltransferase, partial [Actinobacteria bacterium]|nr:glycosyltransferase [Actinomycetota bacterium]
MTLERLTPGAEVNLNRGQTVVVMPVFGGYEFVAESLAAALRHTASDVPLCVINDGSDDDRIGTLVEDLGAAGQPRRLFYIEHESNLGFVESCNEAFERFAPADVVILNSDCVVAEQWLERMQAAAASDARIATVSALSNSGSIISIPERNEPTEGLPAGLSLEAAAERVADVSAQARPPLPAAIGHCMLIRRMALELVGGFDPVFSPGYGEEVDFSARCTAHGLAHVLADDVFVLHHGGASFDRRTDELTELHNDIVFGRYPWLDQSVSEMAGASEGPLDGALMRASLSQRRLRVTVDGSCLAAAWTGTQVHTLGVIAALASNSDVELRVLVSPNLSPETRALIAAQGPSELLSTEDVDHRTRKSDIVHRPFQSGSPSDFEYLSRLGRRIVVSQLDQIHFHNPSYSIEA